MKALGIVVLILFLAFGALMAGGRGCDKHPMFYTQGTRLACKD